jgi:hypothetical protein
VFGQATCPDSLAGCNLELIITGPFPWSRREMMVDEGEDERLRKVFELEYGIFHISTDLLFKSLYSAFLKYQIF